LSWTAAIAAAIMASAVPTETAVSPSRIFELPGDAVFPESIGLDAATGDGYVGSLADGALYRLRASDGGVELWSGAGADGRASVAGVKVDRAGRLWAAGGYDGKLWVYDLARRTLTASFDVGARPSCVNDIAFGPDGEAYVTDSFVPTLFRASGPPLTFEEWIDLREQGVPWPEGLNLNGIGLTSDERHLVTCQTNTGRFWRVELRTGRVSEVALDGGPLEHSDGLACDGSTLYAAINALNRIAVIELTADGASGTVRGLIRSDVFAFPTAIAVRDRQLLIVNAQLDKFGSPAELPFTVVVIDRVAQVQTQTTQSIVQAEHSGAAGEAAT
jgi:superoxide dismutase, Cu-Zn family